MDDLILIILTLIFIVAGIFGQMKKRQAVPEKHSEPQPQTDNFWELLDKQWDETVPSRIEPEAIKEEAFPEKVHRFGPENEGKRIFARDMIQENQIKISEKTMKKKKFSLRDAVIYSEILHRKYN